MQDGAIRNPVTLSRSLQQNHYKHLVYACAKPLNSELSMHSLSKTLTKILGFLFVYLLFKLSQCWYHSLLRFFFLSDLLAIWQQASNKKTNQEELDGQQLKFLDIVHYHVK